MWRSGTAAAIAVVAGLGASAMALALTPLLMPPGYSWLSMTTSESAAQEVDGAWLARLGFVLFGLSVVLLAVLRRRAWGVAATALHGAFGLLMLATAIFSTRSWQPGAELDRTEDMLHSVAATALGFAFAAGVLATALHARHAGRQRRWWLDATAVVASVVLPLAMTALPGADGVLQRAMFATGYAWYAAEAISGPLGVTKPRSPAWRAAGAIRRRPPRSTVTR
jgi:hypothetical protein